MNRSNIAEAAGITRQHLDFILSGKRRPGADLAKRLEKLTGIPRMCWLYPDEYPNPMIKRNGNRGRPCLTTTPKK